MVESAGVWSGSITWWQTGFTGTVFSVDSQRILSPVSSSGTAYYVTNTPI